MATFDSLPTVGDQWKALDFNQEWESMNLKNTEEFGVPYGSRTRVAAVKDDRNGRQGSEKGQGLRTVSIT